MGVALKNSAILRDAFTRGIYKHGAFTRFTRVDFTRGAFTLGAIYAQHFCTRSCRKKITKYWRKNNNKDRKHTEILSQISLKLISINMYNGLGV